jgi:hypothetical protein
MFETPWQEESRIDLQTTKDWKPSRRPTGRWLSKSDSARARAEAHDAVHRRRAGDRVEFDREGPALGWERRVLPLARMCRADPAVCRRVGVVRRHVPVTWARRRRSTCRTRKCHPEWLGARAQRRSRVTLDAGCPCPGPVRTGLSAESRCTCEARPAMLTLLAALLATAVTSSKSNTKPRARAPGRAPALLLRGMRGGRARF